MRFSPSIKAFAAFDVLLVNLRAVRPRGLDRGFGDDLSGNGGEARLAEFHHGVAEFSVLGDQRPMRMPHSE